jgi:hypothetical protein
MGFNLPNEKAHLAFAEKVNKSCIRLESHLIPSMRPGIALSEFRDVLFQARKH